MVNRLTNQSWSNIAATPAVFTLRGGLYALTVVGTFGTSIVLQRLSTDGTTYVSVITALTANGFVTAQLPSGTYKLLVTSVTGIYADLVAIAEPV
jgi:hypothetical protein